MQIRLMDIKIVLKLMIMLTMRMKTIMMMMMMMMMIMMMMISHTYGSMLVLVLYKCCQNCYKQCLYSLDWTAVCFEVSYASLAK